jgi:hypothetical protein
MKKNPVTLDDDPIVGAVFLEPTSVEEQALLLAGSPFASEVVGGVNVGKPEMDVLHVGVVFDGQPQLAVLDRQNGDVYAVLRGRVDGRPEAHHLAKIKDE